MNFNALNGVETKKFILSKIEETLEGSGEFPPHLTYPWFRFEFSLKLTQLSGTPENPGPAGEVNTKLTEEHGDRTRLNTQDSMENSSPELVEFQGSGEVAVPDDARTVSDQPVLVQVESETGVQVDRPKRVIGKKAPWLKEGAEDE